MRGARWHLQDLTRGKSRAVDIDLTARVLTFRLRPSGGLNVVGGTTSSSFATTLSVQVVAMRMSDRIAEKLRTAFTPESLRVEDESHRHEGHAGHRPGGETHFRLYIVSEA